MSELTNSGVAGSVPKSLNKPKIIEIECCQFDKVIAELKLCNFYSTL